MERLQLPGASRTARNRVTAIGTLTAGNLYGGGALGVVVVAVVLAVEGGGTKRLTPPRAPFAILKCRSAKPL
jgi:hypothetical protein